MNAFSVCDLNPVHGVSVQTEGHWPPVEPSVEAPRSCGLRSPELFNFVATALARLAQHEVGLQAADTVVAFLMGRVGEGHLPPDLNGLLEGVSPEQRKEVAMWLAAHATDEPDAGELLEALQAQVYRGCFLGLLDDWRHLGPWDEMNDRWHADRRIRELLCGQDTELDLRGLHFSEMPPLPGYLSRLEVSSRRLQSLAGMPLCMDGLRQLSLTQCPMLVSLNGLPRDLAALELFDLRGTPVVSLSLVTETFGSREGCVIEMDSTHLSLQMQPGTSSILLEVSMVAPETETSAEAETDRRYPQRG